MNDDDDPTISAIFDPLRSLEPPSIGETMNAESGGHHGFLRPSRLGLAIGAMALLVAVALGVANRDDGGTTVDVADSQGSTSEGSPSSTSAESGSGEPEGALIVNQTVVSCCLDHEPTALLEVALDGKVVVAHVGDIPTSRTGDPETGFATSRFAPISLPPGSYDVSVVQVDCLGCFGEVAAELLAAGKATRLLECSGQVEVTSGAETLIDARWGAVEGCIWDLPVS